MENQTMEKLLDSNPESREELKHVFTNLGHAEEFTHGLLNITRGLINSFDALNDKIKTDPITMELVNNLSLIAQNQEAIEEYFSRLQKFLEIHPEDAEDMTINEFFDAYPDWKKIIDTINVITDEAQILPIDREYFPLLATVITSITKQILNNPTRLENPRRGRLNVSEQFITKDIVITYKGSDSELTFTIERAKELFAKRVQNGAKIFNFLMQKMNEQNFQENTEFLLSELIDAGIYANEDSAYRGLKTALEKMSHIHIEGNVINYQGRKQKETANYKTALISERAITYNKCSVVLPQIIRNSTVTFTVLPQWSYSLQSENAYMLLDYIFYLARQNTEKIKEHGYFTINLDTIRQHLGLPSPEEVKTEHNRRYNQLIINPIEIAITAIEDKQLGDELKITPIYDQNHKNIHEYLNGYLKIELTGTSIAYMKERAKALEDEHKKTKIRIETAKARALSNKLKTAENANQKTSD